MMAYYEMLCRDDVRFRTCHDAADVMPLGAAALGGTSFPIDRRMLARELGFANLAGNSMDAVSDRDYLVEFLSACAVVMMHVSRLAEELIVWSSPEFGFVEIDDAFATGSSIMPQKKNPDIAELARAKTARVYGNLMTLLGLMKSLPLAYNRDMQEDKPCVFDSVDTVKSTLRVFCGMVGSLTVYSDRMEQMCVSGFLNATDMADYLVKKGMPFRQAHDVVGKIVRHCLHEVTSLEDLSLERLRRFSSLFENDVFAALRIDSVVNARQIAGGTARSKVLQAIRKARRQLGI
jgi:argininosuccinate lyase